MKPRHFLGLIAVSAFAAKGIYELYRYHNYKSSPNQYIANITKGAIDGVNDVVNIFSNEKRKVEMCDDIAKKTKDGIELITSIAEENEGRNNG